MTEMYKLPAKYAPLILAPHNAVDVRCDTVETTDGVIAGTKFVITWDNTGDRYEDELDEISREKLGVPFSFVRSIWFSRLGRVSDTWHLIELWKVRK